MKMAITIQNGSFAHGKKLLFNDVNLEIGDELVAMIGLNGVGKSSFLEVLSGNYQLTNGAISIQNKAIHAWSRKELSREVALVLTSFDIDSELLVKDVLNSARLPFTGHFGRLTKEDVAIVDKVIVQLKLEDLVTQTFNSCSDGEKQRILIGTAFIKKASIILLDEPTAFMDLNHKIQFFKLLQQEGAGRTILFTTHDVELALQVADRFLILHDKKMKLYTKDELLQSGVLNEMFTETSNGFNAEGKLIL